MTSLQLSLLCGRAAITGTLCALLAGQPVLAEYPAKTVAPAKEIEGRDRVLHALNRLTFGPRMGDVEAVEKIGLNRWFEEQLNPAQIDDSALEARLADYPAMNLPIAVLERKYPGPQALKALSEGKGQLPTDPVQRAMVETQLKIYEQQKKKVAPGNPAMAPAANDMTAQSDMAAPQPATPAQVAVKRAKNIQAGMAALESDKPDDTMGAAAMTPDKPLPAAEIAPDAMAAPTTPEDRASARQQAGQLMALAPADRFAALMRLSPNQLNRMRAGLGPQAPGLMQGFTPEQKEMLIALPSSVRMVALEEMESRMLRDIYSNRQLEAVMTDFWLNHFNVYVRKNQNEPYLIPAFERETIRPNALGNFETMLVATAKSPAMLEYLDNFRSVGPDSMQAARLARAKQVNPNGPLLKQAAAGLNENYGRELMELHTLGVNGGYTQADVTNVAKVFTGWGISRPACGSEFEFDANKHEPGVKAVLGVEIGSDERSAPAGATYGRGGRAQPPCGASDAAISPSEQEGLTVLHMLATSPATAHFISQKLAVRFVSDEPPTALVDRMAASFLSSHGDIKTVLRTMFKSPEFWAADAYRAKVKTPEEFLISAVRVSGAQVINPQALVQSLEKLGQPLYGMQTPNGYSWKKDGWVSTNALVSRMNFALIMTDERLPGVRVDWSALLNGKAGVVPASYTPDANEPAAAKERRLEAVLLGGPVSDRTRQTVIGQSTDQTVTEQAATQFDLTNGAGKQGLPIPKMRGGGRGELNAPPDDVQAAVMAGLLLGSPEFQRR